MTDAQNDTGDDAGRKKPDPEVIRMLQKIRRLPGGDKDPFEDTIAHLPSGLVRTGTSPDTGRPMYTTPADAPLTFTFNEAQEYAEELNRQKAYGFDDWRVPTKGELGVLFQNSSAIGGFLTSNARGPNWYWSSSEQDNHNAWIQHFSDGGQFGNSKLLVSLLRCVRG